MNANESFWLEQARQGDPQAFRHLVERYQGEVFGLCYRMLGDPADAEDAAQETFWKAWRGLASYDPARPFRPWLLTIASRHCIDLLRRRKVRNWLPLLPDLPLRDPAPTPEQQAMSRAEAAALQRALNQLPDAERLTIALFYWHQCSLEDIAAMTGSSVSAVKSRLFRARKRLAAWLSAAPSFAAEKESTP